MMLLLVLAGSAVAAAVPLVRTQSGPTQSLQHDASFSGAPLPKDGQERESHHVSLDYAGHAAMSSLLSGRARREDTVMTVYIQANSGDNLCRGTPEKNMDGSVAVQKMADVELVWKTSTGPEAEWMISGNADGTGIFIKSKLDEFLVFGYEGTLAISDTHNGPWTLSASRLNRMNLANSYGKFLKEDATVNGDLRPNNNMANKNVDDSTLFTLTLKELAFDSTKASAEPVEPTLAPDDPNAIPSNEGAPKAKTNEVTVYIISPQDDGLLRAGNDSVSVITDRSDWLLGDRDPETEWTLVDSGAGDNTVFIASANGYYLRDNQGSLELSTLDQGTDNKMWTVSAEVEQKTSILSQQLRFIEDDTQGNNTVKLGPVVDMSGDESPVKSKNFFTFQVKRVVLIGGGDAQVRAI